MITVGIYDSSQFFLHYFFLIVMNDRKIEEFVYFNVQRDEHRSRIMQYFCFNDSKIFNEMFIILKCSNEVVEYF